MRLIFITYKCAISVTFYLFAGNVNEMSCDNTNFDNCNNFHKEHSLKNCTAG